MSWKDEAIKVIDCFVKGHDYLKQSTNGFIADCKYIFRYAVDSAGSVDTACDNMSSSGVNGRGYRYGYDDRTYSNGNHVYNNVHNRCYRANTGKDRKDHEDTLENVTSGKIPGPEKLSQILDIKKKYFWKNNTQLQEIIEKETKVNVPDISSLIKDAMALKVNDPIYAGITRINYDSGIASQKMKDDFVNAYMSSDKTLKEISQDFEKKYGMHISISTISVRARKHLADKGLCFKNRREAKRYMKA